jgi:hypothetical protein
VKLGPAAGKRRAAEAKVPAVKTVHVALLSACKTTLGRIRFGVRWPTPWIALGAISGAAGLGIVWPPLALLYLAGVSFAHAAYRHSQAIRCAQCLAVFVSPADYNVHTCPPLPRRRRAPRSAEGEPMT